MIWAKDLIKGKDDIKLLDLDNFDNNQLHCVTELTFKNGEDEFRPDITILVNGIPLAFIEVKKPNNHMGIKAERDRMNMRFKNPKFKRFINEFQLLIFSNNMEYNDADRNKLEGAFYATTSKNTSAKFNHFREQRKSQLKLVRNIRQILILILQQTELFRAFFQNRVSVSFSNTALPMFAK